VLRDPGDCIDGGASNDDVRGGNGRDTCLSAETRRSQCEA
jgi:hypothetical protein